MNHWTFQGSEMESLLSEDTKRNLRTREMIKCREWQGWEEFLKKQLTKRKWEEGKCGKAGDGRDGSAVPNGLTGSVVAGGASVHRAQCSPLIHLDRQTIPDKSSNKTVPTFLLSTTNVTYIRKGWFFLREIVKPPAKRQWYLFSPNLAKNSIKIKIEAVI